MRQSQILMGLITLLNVAICAFPANAAFAMSASNCSEQHTRCGYHTVISHATRLGRGPQAIGD
jgi:hypothetical protein